MTNTNEIYAIIANRVINAYDKTQPPAPRYHNPNYQNPFVFNPDDFPPALLKKMEETRIWCNIYERVSPESYSARLILNKIAKSTPPFRLFMPTRIYWLNQLIDEMECGFMSPKIREELMTLFCKFKQTYWAFTKLARIWKIGRTPVRIQTDLYMNELDANHPTTFKLVHTNGLYLFSLQNLVRIIVDAITNQSGMFVEPLPIKNPYTNTLLSKSDLFNIYLAMRLGERRIPELLEKFFKCEFNIFEFRRRHETELRDLAIDQYSRTASANELAQDVSDMLMHHKMTNKIHVSPGFPQKTLVETMTPFLRMYLLERYSFSSMTRSYYSKRVKLELKHFAMRNPDFGRRLPAQFVAPPNCNPFSPTQQYIRREVAFVTKPEPPITYADLYYMKTHIYDEESFENYIECGEPVPPISSINQSSYLYLPPHHNQANNQIHNTPVQPDAQIQERAIAILTRLGRLDPSNIAIVNGSPNNQIAEFFNIQHPNAEHEETPDENSYVEMEMESEYYEEEEEEEDEEDSVS